MAISRNDVLTALLGIVEEYHSAGDENYVVHYGELGPCVGLPDRGNALAQLGVPLGQIVELCHNTGVPCLPAIVVHKQGDHLPGDGFFDAFGACYGVTVNPGDSERRKLVEPIQGVVRGWPSWDDLRIAAGIAMEE